MVRLPSALRILVLTARSVLLLPAGLVLYWCTRRTPGFAHQAFVWMFCVTRGRSNDFMSGVISWLRPKSKIENAMGVLGELREPVLADYVGRLRSDGFIVFPAALSPEVCDRLARFAETTPSRVRLMDGQANSEQTTCGHFDSRNPLAVRYDYPTEALLDNVEVQALLADQSILSLAQEYLGCQPLADVLSMWWHTNYQRQPDAHAAQFFHFDMDRIKWIKVFIYLTDVGPENGPHTFVRGSQRTGGIPPTVLLRGYKRLTDEEVHGLYGRDECLEFSAPRGSIIIEDTRGLHKGAVVHGDARLILQLQFSNSFFGATYPRSRISIVKAPSLQTMLLRAPTIYSQYT